jgi:AcrR family transcriptional regulator
LYPRLVPELPQHFRTTSLESAQLSREVLAEHQRERVISLAIPVFAKRGYRGTSVDDLLAAGKVGVTNFYSLFEGKEDCFLATFDSIVAGAREQLAAAIDGEEGWAEKTVIGLRQLLSSILADPHAARVVLIEAQAAGPESMARYEAILDAATAWLCRGRRTHPEARSLPAKFEHSAIAGLAYYLQQCLLGAGSRDPEELFAETAALILAPVIGTAELRRLQGSLVSTP